MLLHNLQEPDNDLGAGPNENLAFAGLLGVVHVVESIVENRSADHLGCCWTMEILKSFVARNEVSTTGVES